MVQLSDYQMNQSMDGQPVFGNQTSVEDLNNLNKALAAEEITGRETTNLTTASGAPLKVESLEKTLKIVTFNDDQATKEAIYARLIAFFVEYGCFSGEDVCQRDAS